MKIPQIYIIQMTNYQGVRIGKFWHIGWGGGGAHEGLSKLNFS